MLTDKGLDGDVVPRVVNGHALDRLCRFPRVSIVVVSEPRGNLRRPSQITAWFADDDDADSREAAEAVKGMTIDDAWNDVTIQTLIGEHELSWHDVTEELPAAGTDPEGFHGLE